MNTRGEPLGVRRSTKAEEEIARLANFIAEHVPGEPSRSEGAVDTAIRLLSERRDENSEVSE